MLRPHADQAIVVAATTEPEEAKRLVTEVGPDVALLDLRMRTTTGSSSAASSLIVAAMKVVLLTVYDDEQYLFQALRAGAVGLPHQAGGRRGPRRPPPPGHGGEIVVDPELAGRVALDRGADRPAASSGPAATSACPSGRARCSS